MPKTRASSVAEYISKAPKESQPHLRALRALLKSVAPKAAETIKWNLPVYEEGRILYAFAACKAHLNFMPTPSVIRQFKDQLAGYKTGQGRCRSPMTGHFPRPC